MIELYLCPVTWSHPNGTYGVFNTMSIAESPQDAATEAQSTALSQLPAGVRLTSIEANPIPRAKIEEIAERVLGWHRP